MSLTVILCVITAGVSLLANNNVTLKRKLLFNAYEIKHSKEWYRWISHGFVHGDFTHLAVNLWVFYMFGEVVESLFEARFLHMGKFYYLTLYLVGIIASSIAAYLKHQDNPGYNSLGASGAVASVMFAYIMFLPTAGMGLIFLPGVYIPAFLMGMLYLYYEYAMGKRGGGRIAHDAHFWGAIFGVSFVLLLAPETFGSFVDQVQVYISDFIS
jgi:membrane associated rhomboid family serine protease